MASYKRNKMNLMINGPGGNRVSKMTIDEYIKWQRWDEWPERADNPPLTVETVFWYKEKNIW